MKWSDPIAAMRCAVDVSWDSDGMWAILEVLSLSGEEAHALRQQGGGQLPTPPRSIPSARRRFGAGQPFRTPEFLFSAERREGGRNAGTALASQFGRVSIPAAGGAGGVGAVAVVVVVAVESDRYSSHHATGGLCDAGKKKHPYLRLWCWCWG